MYVFRNSEKYIIFDSEKGKKMEIDKSNAEIKVSQAETAPFDLKESLPFDFVIGTVRFVSAHVFILCAKSKELGYFLGKKVFSVERLICLTAKMPGEHRKDVITSDKRGLETVNLILTNRKLYYSRGVNMALCTQKMFERFSAGSDEIFRDDDYFTWNSPMMAALAQADALSFAHAVVNGHFATYADAALGATVTLVSRRDWRRDGFRLTARGADRCGSAANFAETELVVEERLSAEKRRLRAVVLTRGSAPLLWRQPRDFAKTPRVALLGDAAAQTAAFERHFAALRALYGRPVAVSLLGAAGGEGELGAAFARRVAEHNCLAELNGEGCAATEQPFIIEYVAFDFHKECPGRSLANVAKLISEVSAACGQSAFSGLVFVKPNGRHVYVVGTPQTAVFRVNCLDSLDRTNLVQSLLCRHVLRAELKLGAIDETKFRGVWADNGDALSEQYAGTGALKADLTRTGTRTLSGYARDGKNSFRRYLLNNFVDGTMQDGLNVLLGKHDITKTPTLFNERKMALNWKVAAFTALLCFVCVRHMSKRVAGGKNENMINAAAVMVAMLAGYFLGKWVRINEVKTEM